MTDLDGSPLTLRPSGKGASHARLRRLRQEVRIHTPLVGESVNLPGQVALEEHFSSVEEQVKGLFSVKAWYAWKQSTTE